ncbi:MAG: hypothetical protein K9J30_12355 [Bacteroidales bacterium]|nr:hypothetical protein [Bacteroidales bacterium]
MLKKYSYILLFISFLTFFSNCKRTDEKSGVVEADYIEYNVNYLEKMAGDIPTRMLPGMMQAYYTKKHIRTEIKGFFGQFMLVQIADLRKNSVITMLNFFGNKVVYYGKKGEIPAGIKALNNPEIVYTGDTMTICGLTSTRAEVTTNEDFFDIYFVTDIDVNSPNITTPYNFIDYVLSDFRVQLSKLKMQLVMQHHEKTTVQSSAFEVPGEYVEVSRDTMESLINSLFTKE